jgi:hypothetical protein
VAAVTSFEFAGITAVAVATVCRTDPAALQFLNDVVDMPMMCALGGTTLLNLVRRLGVGGRSGVEGRVSGGRHG